MNRQSRRAPSFILIVLFAAALFLLLFIKPAVTAPPSRQAPPGHRRCWNDIDFKEIEQKLRTLPVKEKIPVWKYKGFSRKVRKFNRKKYGPKGRKSYAKIYIVFLQNKGGVLKAVFKPGKKARYEKEVRACRFARFMRFGFVPPAVV